MAIPAKTLNSACVALVLMACAMLAACNTDGAADAQAASAPAQGNSAASAALNITGNPAPSVTAGSKYSFTPAVSPATSGLAYSITNQPTWASFDPATGTLSGTPSAAQIGTYGNITISASNGGATAILARFAIAVVQVGANVGSASLAWTPPTQNTDGTAIDNLAGYNIYYGTDASAMGNKIAVTNPGLTSYTVADLGSGTHYFGITAYTASGVESGISTIGSKTIM